MSDAETTDSEVWTVGRLLSWTTDFLKQRGVDNARLDAEVLLAESRGCERINLYTDFEVEADESTRARFRELVRLRSEGKPVAYLVGHREFYSLDFQVTPDVLIPRPETELLVMTVIDTVKQQFADVSPVAIADVGTGSGVIATCVAKHVPAANVTAVDLSEAAINVASGNAQRHKVDDRVTFLTSDLMDSISADQRFHIIASNPPYVSDEELADLPRDVRDYEPHLALAAGAQGTDVIQRLIPQAAERLYEGGWLMMEISPQIEGLVTEMVEANESFEVRPTIKDLAGLSRIIVAQRQ